MLDVFPVHFSGLDWSLRNTQTSSRSLGPPGRAVTTQPDESIWIRFCPFLPYENSLRLGQSWFNFSQTWLAVLLRCTYHIHVFDMSAARLKPSRSAGTGWRCRSLWRRMLIFVFTVAADADWQSVGWFKHKNVCEWRQTCPTGTSTCSSAGRRVCSVTGLVWFLTFSILQLDTQLFRKSERIFCKWKKK